MGLEKFEKILRKLGLEKFENFFEKIRKKGVKETLSDLIKGSDNDEQEEASEYEKGGYWQVFKMIFLDILTFF